MKVTTIDGLVKISGALGIGASEELRDALFQLLTDQPFLTLDLSEIDSCDTSAIQLLCSLRNSGERLNKPVRILSPSAAVIEISAGLGLSLDDLTFECHGPQEGASA